MGTGFSVCRAWRDFHGQLGETPPREITLDAPRRVRVLVLALDEQPLVAAAAEEALQGEAAT